MPSLIKERRHCHYTNEVHRALIQLVTPSEVAIAVRIAAIVWIMNFQVSRFFMAFVVWLFGYLVILLVGLTSPQTPI